MTRETGEMFQHPFSLGIRKHQQRRAGHDNAFSKTSDGMRNNRTVIVGPNGDFTDAEGYQIQWIGDRRKKVVFGLGKWYHGRSVWQL